MTAECTSGGLGGRTREGEGDNKRLGGKKDNITYYNIFQIDKTKKKKKVFY